MRDLSLFETDATATVRGRTTPGRRDEDRARALAELSASLAEAITDTDALLRRMVHLISQFLGDTAVIRLLDADEATLRVAATADRDPHVAEIMRRALEATPRDIRLLTQHAAAVRSGELTLIEGDALTMLLHRSPAQFADALDQFGITSLLVCPLRIRGRVIGTLGLYRRGERGPHSERDQKFAQECADRTALALENASLVNRLQAQLEETRRSEENYRLTAELLQRADEKRRSLIEHLVTAQEEERRRIAVDVHDDSIQAMAALGLRLQMLRRSAPNTDFGERISELEDTVTESIGRLRNLLFRLEAGSLDKVGLARAITRYASELFPDGRPTVRVHNRLDAEPPSVVQIVLYRIAQEALTNVRKHAEAARVTVTLSSPAAAAVMLVVHDDGAGFNVDEVRSQSLPGHLGLRGMEQRAEMGGGRLVLKSLPGKGTTVECLLPLLGEDHLAG